MAMNMDAAIRIKANVEGQNNIRQLSQGLKGLEGASKLSNAELGRFNIAINRMAREAGSTTAGLRQHIGALQQLRDRVDIGSKSYNRLGVEIDQLKGKLRGLDGEAKKTGSSLKAQLVGGLASAGVGAAASGIINASVSSVESERRIKSLSQGLDDYRNVQNAANEAAGKFGVTQTQANQQFAQLYARLRPIGLSLGEIETVYNGFNTAAKLSGASSTEAGAAFLQLSQALGTGVLRGEELNSIFEQTPTIVQNIAAVMGVPIGQIRQLAEDGKITGDIVLQALGRIEKEGAPKLAEAMKGPAQQFQNLKIASNEVQIALGNVLVPVAISAANALTTLLNVANGLPGPVKNLGAAFVLTAGGLVALGGAVQALGGIGTLATAFGGLSTALKGATVAQAGLNLAVLANPYVAATAAVIGLTVAAYKLITPFREFVDSIPAQIQAFFGSLSRDGMAALDAIISAAQNAAKIAVDIVVNAKDLIAQALNSLVPLSSSVVSQIGTAFGGLAPVFQNIAQAMSNAFAGSFSFINIRFGDLINGLISQINPWLNVLKLIPGADIGGAIQNAVTAANQAGSGSQRLAAAGVGSTYADAQGNVYNTATGRLQQAAPARNNVVPRTQLASASGPIGQMVGGGGGSTGGKAPKGKTEESLSVQIAKSLKSALNLNDAQAAGILGNLIRESGLNPRVNEGGAVGLPRMVGGYGLAQWTGSRQQDLINFSGGKQQAGDLGTQLRFIVKELLGPESNSLSMLRKAQSPEEAAVSFDKYYERSEVKALGERKANARNVFRELAGSGPGSGLSDYASMIENQQQALQASMRTGDEIIKQLDRQNVLAEAKTDFDREMTQISWEYKDTLEKINALQDANQKSKALEYLDASNLLKISKAEGKQTNSYLSQSGLNPEQSFGSGGASGMFRSDLDLMGQQEAALQGVLDKYPQIGQAASAAAQLVTQSVSSMISGTQSVRQAFSDFLKSIGDMLIETAQKMIGQYIAIGVAKMFAGLGSATGGLGAAGSAAGSAAFGGAGSGALGFQIPALFAKGGVMTSKGPMPLRSYSKGGIANSPQLAMFGEGKTPEAFVPLPDGRRIPVAMSMGGGGKGGLREAMGGGSGGNAGAPMLNMSFETTKFGDTEYVSRDQLESAMAATRRQASRDGARRGMSMTLDKLQQSPGTRSRVGIR